LPRITILKVVSLLQNLHREIPDKWNQEQVK